MNILVICQYYKPEPFRVSDVCEALVQDGHAVTVVTGTPNYPQGVIYNGYEHRRRQDEIVDGVTVHRCPIHPRKHGGLHRLWNYYSFVWSAKRYLKGMRQEFDVVLIYQLSPIMMAQPAIYWAKRHGKRCVLYCLDLWPESLLAGGISKGSFIYRIYRGISRRIYTAMQEILISSQGFEAYLRQYLGIKNATVAYLPQYAEPLFSQVATDASFEAGETLHALFAGNIGEMQSVETILAAAALLKDRAPIHIHIVGDGSRWSQCVKMAEGLNNVTFYGRKRLEEMPEFYAKADVMLVTLRADPIISMTLPGKVQSYLAAGKPVVGAINGETARVIQSACCGWCGPAEDAERLAENLMKAATNRTQLKRYGDNALQYYQSHYDKATFMKHLTEALRRNC